MTVLPWLGHLAFSAAIYGLYRRRKQRWQDEKSVLMWQLSMYRSIVKIPNTFWGGGVPRQSKPAPSGVKPTEGLAAPGGTQRRRQRWQNDKLGVYDEHSDELTPEEIKRKDEQGNLRLQDDGNLWGTALGGGLHAPILDLDFPHTYVPSKTEGHGHLYIHKAVSSRQLAMILAALNRAKLMGKGNVHQFEVRGQLFAAATNKEAVKAGETLIEVEA